MNNKKRFSIDTNLKLYRKNRFLHLYPLKTFKTIHDLYITIFMKGTFNIITSCNLLTYPELRKNEKNGF